MAEEVTSVYDVGGVTYDKWAYSGDGSFRKEQIADLIKQEPGLNTRCYISALNSEGLKEFFPVNNIYRMGSVLVFNVETALGSPKLYDCYPPAVEKLLQVADEKGACSTRYQVANDAYCMGIQLRRREKVPQNFLAYWESVLKEWLEPEELLSGYEDLRGQLWPETAETKAVVYYEPAYYSNEGEDHYYVFLQHQAHTMEAGSRYYLFDTQPVPMKEFPKVGDTIVWPKMGNEVQVVEVRRFCSPVPNI